jgi:AraC-like DNA-binding protein
VPPGPRALREKIAPVFLRAVLQEARRLGIDCVPLCSGLGFAAADLDLPGFMVSHLEAATVMRRALRAIDRPELGLELGMRSNLANRGALALGLLASPTLGDAVRLMLRFPASAGLMLEVHEESAARQHALVAAPLFGNHDIEPFLVDKLFSGLVRLCRQGAGAGFAPIAVELVRPAPATALDHETYFACPVRFGCLRNRLVSDARWMATVFPTANTMSFRYAEQALQAETLQAGGSAVGMAVARVMRNGPPHATSPAEVASSLHLSERTLRRRLMESGLSYRTLLDEGRKSRALTLVLNGQMDLAAVALETGFADLGNFRRAFKRWTGQTPNQMRDRSA